MVEKLGATIGAFRLSRWLTSNRLFCAWELMKQCKGTYTAWQFARGIGCSQRTVYRWLNEEAVPSPLALEKLEGVFVKILGENWLNRVETFENMIRQSNLIKGGRE